MTTADPRPPVPHRVATTVLTLLVPLVITAAGVALALGWSDELPDPVATHWGTDGADGFMSLTGALAVLVATTVGTSVVVWALLLAGGRDASIRRIGTGTTVGLVTMLVVLVVGSLELQRGLADATAAPTIDSLLGLALGGGLVLGVVAALLVPTDPASTTTAVPPADAERLPLGRGERAAWSTTVWSPAAVAVAAPVVVLQLVLAVALQTWVLVAVAIGLGALLASMLVLRVTVDARGLDARSPLGWPRLRVPLDEVVAAHADTVRPLADFGGWGYRVGRDGRTGFVLRSGDAVVVERTGGRTSVVTVDDARTGAALLNALAERSRVR